MHLLQPLVGKGEHIGCQTSSAIASNSDEIGMERSCRWFSHHLIFDPERQIGDQLWLK
jgi:hypothetical protein